MLIDTHAHLNFSAYKNDVDEVIKRALKNNIWMINVGSQYATSKKAVEIVEKYPEAVYAAVGLHPIHAQEKFNYKEYRKLAEFKKIVAIGEIGLDYKVEYFSFKERQKQVFLEQIDLAKELNLPIIFHCRMAHNDLIEILKSQIQKPNPTEQGKVEDEEKSQRSSKLQGVVHCFTGTWEQAKQYLEMGFYLGFNGIIFKLDLDQVIKKTPMDKILLETDCPYLSPPRFSGQRNEPFYIKYIAEKIAEIKDISYQEVANITTQNAKELFDL